MQRIRNIAYDFFVRQKLKLPLDMEQLNKILKKIGCKLHTYSEGESLITFLESSGYVNISTKNGFTYQSHNTNDPPRIFYKDELAFMQKINVICHEIAHIILRHTSHNGIMGKNKLNLIENVQEKEADIFALELQSPIPILRQMNITTVHEIEERGILNRIDAIKQITHMHERTLSKMASSILLSIAVSAALLLAFSLFNKIVNKENVITPETYTATYTKQITIDEDISGIIVLEDEQKSNIVFVTSSGKKYHKSTCQYVKNRTNIIELTIDEAEYANYETCKVCKPDLK